MAERRDLEEKQLSTAAALISKAQATSFAAEREALVLRAYTQLAAYLNQVAPSAGSTSRRRERRLLVDRRARRNRSAATSPTGDVKSTRGASVYQSAASRRSTVGIHFDVET